ncbi:MAG: murein biosynthesis integral rane protein MurJ, partial [Microvirga sp.]|nr:murein biosynthesis integral rane protein MurJ [Microvirga sp.]
RDWMAPSAQLGRILAAVACATFLLALFAWFAPAPLSAFAAALPRWRSEILLVIVGAGGAIVYGASLLAGLKLAGVKLARR